MSKLGYTWTDPRGVYGSVTNVTSTTVSNDINPLRISQSYVSMSDLDSEVFKASIEDLINLWVTRFGNEWIDLVDIEKEPFFTLAYQRLRQMGELEQHYLTDRSRYVCRRPE